MALAHDVTTRFPAGAATVLDTTTGDRTFSHAATSSARGVVVVLMCGSATVDGVTGVDYGGIALVKSQTNSDSDELGRVTIWTSHELIIPTGTQTVTLQGCTADAKAAFATTLTATNNRTRVNASNGANTTTSTNPTVTVVTTATTILVGAVHGGAAADTSYAVGTNYTVTNGIDYGARAGRGQYRTSPVASGSIPFNFTFATSDDWCIAAVAVEEIGTTYTETGREVSVTSTVAVADTFTAALVQEGFRWRNDDGSQTSATWLAAQDTDASLLLGASARLRVLIDTPINPGPLAYTLYYKKTTDSTWLPVDVGSGGGGPVYVATSANVAASGEATTAQLTAPAGKTTARFVTGRMWDDENGTDSIDI